MMAKFNLRDLAVVADKQRVGNAPPSLEEARTLLSGDLPDLWKGARHNAILGGEIREEDSPGNYTLRETERGLEMLGYDATGNPWVVGRWATNGFQIEPNDLP